MTDIEVLLTTPSGSVLEGVKSTIIL